MQEKCGKFMADWRDATGRRHRKAFTTKAEAAAHAEQMRGSANPQQRRASRGPSRTTSKRNPKTRTAPRLSKSSARNSVMRRRAT